MTARSCLDHHLPGDISRTVRVRKIPVGKKRNPELRKGRPESSLNLVRGTGEEQEHLPANKVPQITTFYIVPVLFLIGLYVKTYEKRKEKSSRGLEISYHLKCLLQRPRMENSVICDVRIQRISSSVFSS